jgi:hypothetical protein
MPITPMQGECFSDCPLMAALASIAWVNRLFIANNISGPDANGNYKFTFWDYGPNNPMTPTTMGQNVGLNGQINPVDQYGNPTGIKTYVTVGPQVLLDSNSRFSDPNGTFYGAGSSNANEVWPALFERAYAKFCYYENGLTPSAGALSCTNGVDANGNPIHIISGPDPTFTDVLNLGNNPANPSQNLWGGNAGVGLMYLTGRNCFQLNSSATTFTVPQNSHVTSGANGTSLYNFVKVGFCSTTFGRNKTRYPLVAWTYPNGCQTGGVQYNTNASLGILASHCYSILGTFDSTNGCINNHSYIVLRTTFGLSDPTALTNVSPSGNGLWSYDDVGFQMGSTPQYPPGNAPRIPQTLDLSKPTDAIFGLDQAVFSNYFESIGWVEGY